MANRRFAVIGLGRFGSTLAQGLAASGQEVIAIDSGQELIEGLQDVVDQAVRLDATDEKALRAQGVDKVDVAVVCIGENFEANLLATVLLRDMGVPEVVARATSQVRAQILKLVGATEVVLPEDESASRLAQRLAAPNVVDFLSIAEGFSLVQLKAPKTFHHHSLDELALRRKFGITVLAIRRQHQATRDRPAGEDLLSAPGGDEVIEPGDELVVVGPDEALAKLPRE